MGQGTIRIEARTGGNAVPVQGEVIIVRDVENNIVERLVTDESGVANVIALPAPDASLSLDLNYTGDTYAIYRVTVSQPNFLTVEYPEVQVYDGIETVILVEMAPSSTGTRERGQFLEVRSSAPAASTANGREQRGSNSHRSHREVIIPEYITVHLGRKDESARNVRIRFTDYIKNVASNEIYATWPEAALVANIYAIITFTLNRIYTEWYRSQGYAFDITNSTSTDMAFIFRGETFGNIDRIVDNIFNQYVRRQGHQEPYFTPFCDGKQVSCPGLSQWGTVTLAERGMTPMEILRHYYPSDIELVETNNIGGVTASYPGAPLREGYTGPEVRRIQETLNRIRTDYPAIPKNYEPDGVFGPETTEAVKAFQRIFNLTPDGIVGKDTWYKIARIYVAIKKLGELDSEGIRVGIRNQPPTVVLKQGSKGNDVVELQFILGMLSAFYPNMPSVVADGTFGNTTKEAVMAFQEMVGLPEDGIVGPSTWEALYDVYRGIDEGVDLPRLTEPPLLSAGTSPSFPGILFHLNSRGESVRWIQKKLDAIAGSYPSIPKVASDGVFGSTTEDAVKAFQNLFGLPPDGIVGADTWDKLESVSNDLYTTPSVPAYPAYPGYYVSVGSYGSYVKMLQEGLNALSAYNPSIPRLTPDGNYGAGTKRAVQAFQKVFGLPQDGIVGRSTWDRIMSEYAKLRV
jgi:peptidoglycan hydrolase-like protein with peptidoglycan-binding domain